MEITISSQTCLNSVILYQLITAALTSPRANPSAQCEKDTSSCIHLTQEEVCETRGLSTPLSLGSSHVHGSVFSPLSRTLFIFLSAIASTAHSLWHHGLWRVSVFPHSLGFRVPEFSVHLFILLQLLTRHRLCPHEWEAPYEGGCAVWWIHGMRVQQISGCLLSFE